MRIWQWQQSKQQFQRSHDAAHRLDVGERPGCSPLGVGVPQGAQAPRRDVGGAVGAVARALPRLRRLGPCLAAAALVDWGRDDRANALGTRQHAMDLFVLDWGHVPPAERPADFDAAVSSFLGYSAGSSS